MPGAYAETFGIVMSESLSAGIPVIGARYGALGERIRAHGCGWTIDPMDPDGIRVLIERLDRARDELVRVTRQVLQVPLETVDETAHRYAALYRDGARVRQPVTSSAAVSRHLAGGLACELRAAADDAVLGDHVARPVARFGGAARGAATLSSWPSGNNSMSLVDTR